MCIMNVIKKFTISHTALRQGLFMNGEPAEAAVPNDPPRVLLPRTRGTLHGTASATRSSSMGEGDIPTYHAAADEAECDEFALVPTRGLSHSHRCASHAQAGQAVVQNIHHEARESVPQMQQPGPALGVQPELQPGYGLGVQPLPGKPPRAFG